METSKVRTRGFTLIELMIVVVVIGILAAIAYPAYQNHVIQSQRADAHDALLRVQMEQERHRANNPEYAESLSDLPGYTGNTVDSPDKHYRITIEDGADGSSYTVSANAQGRQAADEDCDPIQLVVTGGSADRQPPDCW